MQQLFDKIRNDIPLSPEAEEHIYSIGEIKNISKGDLLIQQGHTVHTTFFVTEGCLRSFYVDKDGKEHTLQFAVNDWWISDFMAVYNQDVASLTVECIQDSRVIEFQMEQLQEIYPLFPEFETFQRKNLERHVMHLHKRILNQLRLTATERYELFIRQYPNIEQFTPNYYIASYLGVTKESLSRIRKLKAQK
ncbi:MULTISPECIES: Crp/Fnr family transcriptional regulator [Flammeovirga]|uniref:Crp/Fnr family transcriptional regulator n=1 Tax=Flammeovirga agarivorans TaxID=2726742 RepID=A0A7X8SJL4_9BACT|nr:MULTISPECIES: Crp/Fnr family transcriptional regulator [Flammeovirga]NLR91439.1 Crp/Fnr family transcriptional regulator [Flammeovirga agarivorans]